jgi:hypothetical protein
LVTLAAVNFMQIAQHTGNDFTGLSGLQMKGQGIVATEIDKEVDRNFE